MVNGLIQYIVIFKSTDSFKRFTTLVIHLFTHTFMHWENDPPIKYRRQRWIGAGKARVKALSVGSGTWFIMQRGV